MDLQQEQPDNIEADKETRQQIRLMDCLWMSGMGFYDSGEDLSAPKDWEKMREMGGESGKTNRERFQAREQSRLKAWMETLASHTLPAGWEW